jgi:energy-coupling factor transporter ATP-binding protein EcfA2
MHIASIRIRNIRSIRELEWELGEQNPAGWHVVLGDNGSGKSTFLKAIALALIGPKEAQGLRQRWDEWLRRGTDAGGVDVRIIPHQEFDKLGDGDSWTSNSFPSVGIELTNRGDYDEVELTASQDIDDPDRIWRSAVWFCGSYGPFRRFGGGDFNSESSLSKMAKLSRHLSLFDERVALTECLEWLSNLKYRELEKDPEGRLLEPLTAFINHGDFLPSGVRLHEVSSREIVFKDANGVDVLIQNLSDGYRSVLSMTFELIRQLSMAYGPDGVFSEDVPGEVKAPGVVLIDEIDVHLHPTWQKRVGRWFREHFPNIQFIVSTHSPLVCQSAEHGSIFVLPSAGTEKEGHMLGGDELNRVLYGSVLDAYGTEAFGQEAASTRSESSRQKSKRLAELNNKEILKGLTSSEIEEQAELRAALPSSSAGQS